MYRDYMELTLLHIVFCIPNSRGFMELTTFREGIFPQPRIFFHTKQKSDYSVLM